jgi:hypothetical protein
LAVNINILHLVIGSVIAVAVILILLAIGKRRRSSDYKISKILTPMTKSKVDNIIIPDGIGGLLEIEQLRLLEQGILIVETYPISGHLFGAEEIDQWTQLIKGRSYKFANPLRHIRTSRQAVMSLAPGIPVFYSVIFSADASFPKGKPEGMSVLDSLADDLKSIRLHPKQIEQTQLAWDKLLRIARKNGHAAKVGEEF